MEFRWDNNKSNFAQISTILLQLQMWKEPLHAVKWDIFNYHRDKASTELNLRVGSPSNSSFFLPVRRIILLLPFGASMLCVSYSSSVRQFLSLFDATFFLLVSVYFDRKITPAYEITRWVEYSGLARNFEGALLLNEWSFRPLIGLILKSFFRCIQFGVCL